MNARTKAGGILARRQGFIVVLTLTAGACSGSMAPTPTAPDPVPVVSPAPPPTPAPSPLPPPPVLATVTDLSMQPPTVPPGQQATGTVTVASPAVSGTLVWLTTNDPSATVPVSVAIAEGETRGTFTVTTQSVIVDTTVMVRATSGVSERSTPLRLIAPPPPTSGQFLRFISNPGDYVGQGQSLRFEPSSSVRFRGIVWTWARGSGSDHELVLTIAEMTPRYRDWGLTLVAPRGQRLVPGVYRNATRTPDITTGGPALRFSGDGRACNQSSGEFEIFEARYAPRPPNGERIERLVARFRQVCDGSTGAMTGELSLSDVPTF